MIDETGAPLRARHALVVDDDAGIRALVCRVLNRHNFTTESARDGGEAIEMLLQHDYDVVVLDLMMPRIDGFGVIRYLGEHHPEILRKVIVVTAFGEGAAERINPPITRFLEKPFDIKDLVAEAHRTAAQQ